MQGGEGAGISGGSQLRTRSSSSSCQFTEETITARMTEDDIDNAIRMHEGDSLPGFPSPDTFEFLILPHLRKVCMPAVECVNNAAAALEALANKLARTVFRRFPKLAEAVLELTSNIIQREKENTRVVVEQLVAYETGYLFTNDEQYLTQHGSMQKMYEDDPRKNKPAEQKPVEEKPPEPGALQKGLLQGADMLKEGGQQVWAAGKQAANYAYGKEEQRVRPKQRCSGPFVTEIRRRLDAYFSLVIRSVRDSVPKSIGYFLVRAVQDKLQFELLSALNQDDKLRDLLGEPVHIREERKSLNEQLKVLQKAHTVLTRDP